MQTLLLGPPGCLLFTFSWQKASAFLSQASVDVHTETFPVPSSGRWGRCIPVPIYLHNPHQTGQSNLAHNAGCFWPLTCPSNLQGLDLYAWKPEASYCNPAGLVSILITDFPLGNN